MDAQELYKEAAPGDRGGAAARQELVDYEIRVNQKANIVAGAMRAGAHDDLVVALGLAILDEHCGRFDQGPRLWI